MKQDEPREKPEETKEQYKEKREKEEEKRLTDPALLWSWLCVLASAFSAVPGGGRRTAEQ